ncbi:unnamed protein product [Calicophoron daubneyi]|uniref:C2HC/C3H-type domain-containing protein n=1 Tax=Calicophoron daubneyi TaxID=300641 RepID=A0AAV2TLB4_CALDB
MAAVSRRPFVVCYICGREFGSASIGIHEPQCLKKWRQQNNLRPKSERLPTPVKPDTQLNIDPTQPIDSKRNVLAKSQFNEAAAMAAKLNLVPCPICERTFNADRIDIHKRFCKGKSKVKELTRNYNNSTRTEQSLILETCKEFANPVQTDALHSEGEYGERRYGF